MCYTAYKFTHEQQSVNVTLNAPSPCSDRIDYNYTASATVPNMAYN